MTHLKLAYSKSSPVPNEMERSLVLPERSRRSPLSSSTFEVKARLLAKTKPELVDIAELVVDELLR
jgi:hypothetical protein